MQKAYVVPVALMHFIRFLLKLYRQNDRLVKVFWCVNYLFISMLKMGNVAGNNFVRSKQLTVQLSPFKFRTKGAYVASGSQQLPQSHLYLSLAYHFSTRKYRHLAFNFSRQRRIIESSRKHDRLSLRIRYFVVGCKWVSNMILGFVLLSHLA